MMLDELFVRLLCPVAPLGALLDGMRITKGGMNCGMIDPLLGGSSLPYIGLAGWLTGGAGYGWRAT